MNKPRPEGNKNGIAPGTKLPKPTKTVLKPEPKAKAPIRPKHPIGRLIGDGPSVWNDLAEYFDIDDHR